MKTSLRNSLAVLVLSTAVAGIAAPAFADSYYQGIDAHAIKPRTTTAQPRMMYDNGSVDRMSTGSIYRTAPPRVIYQQPSFERYQGGDGEYYQGIVPPSSY
ncbi:hypothetical protein BLJAPNOD_02123 [Ensifer sp. M14]|jgi:hypothetical protein|uniref:hypothetical protein n=1 Tax=Ensifer sp. M14 TaxID=2203782 RepID=UPI000E1D23C4|nr:hypothetical protein [Ensifer sp. M14]RDL50995.1 hypothetical protein BLJAPNOD_02123 [Ensifer sp. M14]